MTSLLRGVSTRLYTPKTLYADSCNFDVDNYGTVTHSRCDAIRKGDIIMKHNDVAFEQQIPSGCLKFEILRVSVWLRLAAKLKILSFFVRRRFNNEERL